MIHSKTHASPAKSENHTTIESIDAEIPSGVPGEDATTKTNKSDDNSGKEAGLYGDNTISYVTVFTISRLSARLSPDSKILLSLPQRNQQLSRFFRQRYNIFVDSGLVRPLTGTMVRFENKSFVWNGVSSHTDISVSPAVKVRLFREQFKQAYTSAVATNGTVQLAIVFSGLDGFCTNFSALSALFGPCPLDVLIMIHHGRDFYKTYSSTKIQAALVRQSLIRPGTSVTRKESQVMTDQEKEDETYDILLEKIDRCVAARETLAKDRRASRQINEARRNADDDDGDSDDCDCDGDGNLAEIELDDTEGEDSDGDIFDGENGDRDYP